MNWKMSIIRAGRTFCQVLAGALIALPIAEAISDIKVLGGSILLAFYSALMAAVVALLQGLAESSTNAPIPGAVPPSPPSA